MSFLISIHPEWVIKIFNGDKTAEIRRTAPKDWMDYLSGKTKKKPEPMTGYIYCTQGKPYVAYVDGKTYTQGDSTGRGPADICLNGKVVAKFTLREVEEYKVWDSFNLVKANGIDKHSPSEILKRSCLSGNELVEYLGGISGKRFYAWHISDLQIFDKPKELWEFGIRRAPQSWQYVIYPYGFSAGEKVKLAPQCAEYHGKEDKVYEVLGEPKRIGGRHCTPICYNGINQYFATEYLTYAEAKE